MRFSISAVNSPSTACAARMFTADSSSQQNRVITRTLYRQMLRWTKRTGNEVPLDPIPPVYVVPPQVSGTILQKMASYRDMNSPQLDHMTQNEKHLYNLIHTLPRNAIVSQKNMTIPIHKVSDIENVIKVTFKMNQFDHDRNVTKNRISLAFEYLKSLNQMSEALDLRKKKRLDSMNREKVAFRIGQVVRHKTGGWRGVIHGWNRVTKDNTSSSNKTSLTNKTYPVKNIPLNNVVNDVGDIDMNIQYQVHLDEGDASLSRLRLYGSTTVSQNELELVTDKDLKRIRNLLLKDERFNLMTGEFEPNKILKFEYPNDNNPRDMIQDAQMVLAKHENAKRILGCVHDISSQLYRIILDCTSCAAYRKLHMISYFEKKLLDIIDGNLSNNIADALDMEHLSHKKAIQHVHAILNVSIEVHSLVWRRRMNQLYKQNMIFPLGSVVKHKLYGFRGVVIDIDPYPKMDVSNWDGLKDVEGDVVNMPFYHVIPDTDDTIKAFGSERSFRYVCQDNLLPCNKDEKKNINANLDDGWFFDGEKYSGPDFSSFCHNEPIASEDLVVECINALETKCSEIFVRLMNGASRVDKHDQSSDVIGDDFLDLLRYTDCLEDAFVVDEAVKEMMKAHLKRRIRFDLDDGISHLLRGDKRKALEIFDKTIKEDNNYSDLWNKKSTCHYLLGEYPESIEASNYACSINQMNYQTYAGLGLIYYDMSLYEKAAIYFRKCLSLNPWSPVSSRLNVCLDLLSNMHSEAK